MAIFTTVKSDQFTDLSNTPTDILVAEEHSIQVNSIVVTSTSIPNIQVNLQRSIKPVDADAVVANIVSNRTVSSSSVRQPSTEPAGIELLEFPYFLGLNPEGSVDKLICFSNAASQKFNLQVSYTILNETPFGGAC